VEVLAVIMYHCTKRKYLENIIEHGLLPKKPDGITNAIEGVYVSVYPFDWMDFTTEQGKYAGLMIAVDITGIEMILDNGIDDNDLKKHPAFVSLEAISTDRFVRVSVSTNERPNFFDDITEKVFQKEKTLIS